MTRINIIPPIELTDQHLVAEYREIFMVGSALQRSIVSKYGVDSTRISKNYTLNTGHVYFFYDKGKYLYKRYLLLIEEMKNRGMNVDKTREFPKWKFPDEFFNDWIPSEDDFCVIRERISYRINQKPNWYRYYGTKI